MYQATKFAQKCFTPLELYELKDVFKSLADHEGHLRYLKEDTIAKFLEIPDILGASPVVFQMLSYIGAFPFLNDAPAVLGFEQMIMVITIMTERYKRILAKGATDRRKLLFKSLAVYDRKLSEMDVEKKENETKTTGSATDGTAKAGSQVAGFAVDKAGEEEADDFNEEEDDLVLAALESLDYLQAFKHESHPHSTQGGAMIPADNFRKLIMLLLLAAPLGPQESLSIYASRLVGDELDSLRSTAECILAAFLNVETSPGIKFSRFNTVLPVSLPYLFNGFNNLFEHFLFSKELDFTKHKEGTTSAPTGTIAATDVPQPLLQDQGSIMNLNVLSQLSFFIPGTSLFRRLRLLYSGDNDGFSMGSFETKVFNWRAPTILLVRGSRLEEDGPGYHSAGNGAESTFTASLPPRRFPTGSSGRTDSDSLTFGVYLPEPWRHTHREAFGGEETTLFQLEPVHDVFHASSLNTDRATFSRPSSATDHPGVTFGCPPPGQPSSSYGHHKSGVMSLGPVSLVLDSSFEFGCFTHDYGSRGGAFRNSVARKFDFQERFSVESLEVWGCGGDEEARAQAERWAWEAREAEARRKINLGTGDIEADRALLEMAGLIGGNRSGGSMA
jgi:hypothetical protein